MRRTPSARSVASDDSGPESLVATRRLSATGVLIALVVAAIAFRPLTDDWFDAPAIATWSTIFVAIVIQALPFLVMGVVLSGAIAAFVSQEWLARHLPRRPAVAVPVAGLAGVALPGCECGSVPIAGRLTAGGAAPAVALTFMLTAPAINPVVIISTAVAFPGQPEFVGARFLASLATGVAVGLIWLRLGRDDLLDRRRFHSHHSDSRLGTWLATARHDFLHAGGWLVVGAAAAATLQTAVPRSVLDGMSGSDWIAIPVLAALAILLSVCSEADAFVASGLNQFSLTSRLVFLVVGPVVDLKLVALQAGVFGPRFALRFAPLTLAVAIACATLAGWWLL